jgi:hypothetical protein
MTILVPIIALAVNAITQVCVFRARRGGQYFRSIVEGFLAGAIVFALLEPIFLRGHLPHINSFILALFVDFPTYLALSYCSYSFVQLGQTSIRIRMYSEIASSPNGVSVAELNAQYDDAGLLRVRIQRLTEGGDIVLRDGRYFIGRRRFLQVSNILFAGKRFLLGRESEFPAPPP